jgi:hypothetical protein
VTVTVAVPFAQRPATTAKLTTPKEQFGHDIGDDYYLANYTQYVEYLHKLDQQSDRMTVVEIGKTEEGRPELTAIITSPENHKKLAQFKESNRKARACRRPDRRAGAAAREDGKTVVWIDGGLHATEVLGAQQLIETIYRLNSKADPETMRILNDDIILCTLINPDGMELVSNWYMREPDEKKRSTGGIPRLYQKYIGHDDNRDFYMMNMSESVNANQDDVSRVVPGDHVQPSPDRPAGAVLFAPPFRDPFNYNFDPLSSSASTRSARRSTRAWRGREAGRGDALGDELLDLVQRRHPHDLVLPQPDRHPDRDDRQPDAGRESRSCSTCSCRAPTSRIRSPRARSISARPSSTR